jgi:hypothetical protein
MTDLEKYKKVNSTESLKELAEVIRSFAVNGRIQGRKRTYNADSMAIGCEHYNLLNHNVLTREFGIRQQAMMLLFYRDKK